MCTFTLHYELLHPNGFDKVSSVVRPQTRSKGITFQELVLLAIGVLPWLLFAIVHFWSPVKTESAKITSHHGLKFIQYEIHIAPENFPDGKTPEDLLLTIDYQQPLRGLWDLRAPSTHEGNLCSRETLLPKSEPGLNPELTFCIVPDLDPAKSYTIAYRLFPVEGYEPTELEWRQALELVRNGRLRVTPGGLIENQKPTPQFEPPAVAE